MESLAGDDPAEIGGYRLGARLGAGGMGRVYLAFTAGGRPVALKIVPPDGCTGCTPRRFSTPILMPARRGW
jgi:hypothetical protein